MRSYVLAVSVSTRSSHSPSGTSSRDDYGYLGFARAVTGNDGKAAAAVSDGFAELGASAHPAGRAPRLVAVGRAASAQGSQLTNVPDADGHAAAFARAFRSLPWPVQVALWGLVIEGIKPAEIVSALGPDAGAVVDPPRQLLSRYLVELAQNAHAECAMSLAEAARLVEADPVGGVAELDEHVGSCSPCRTAFPIRAAAQLQELARPRGRHRGLRSGERHSPPRAFLVVAGAAVLATSLALAVAVSRSGNRVRAAMVGPSGAAGQLAVPPLTGGAARAPTEVPAVASPDVAPGATAGRRRRGQGAGTAPTTPAGRAPGAAPSPPGAVVPSTEPSDGSTGPTSVPAEPTSVPAEPTSVPAEPTAVSAEPPAGPQGATGAQAGAVPSATAGGAQSSPSTDALPTTTVQPQKRPPKGASQAPPSTAPAVTTPPTTTRPTTAPVTGAPPPPTTAPPPTTSPSPPTTAAPPPTTAAPPPTTAAPPTTAVPTPTTAPPPTTAQPPPTVLPPPPIPPSGTPPPLERPPLPPYRMPRLI